MLGMGSVTVSGREKAKRQATANSREVSLERPVGTQQGITLETGRYGII